MSTPTASSPLETVARNHGATMASRHGRRVPAHFGSVGAEEAVCLRAVGMADRSDRDTFELRGTPSVVEGGEGSASEPHAARGGSGADDEPARGRGVRAHAGTLAGTDVAGGAIATRSCWGATRGAVIVLSRRRMRSSLVTLEARAS